MPNNILEEYNATSEQRIDDKTEIYSVTTVDVGKTIREGVELGAIITTTIVGKTYPKGWRAIDSSFNLYVAKLENVSSDVNNATNWKLIGSGAGKQVWDLTMDSFPSNAYEVTNPSITSYKTDDIYIATPDVPNTGACTAEINSLGALPIKKASGSSYVDLIAGDFSATSYLLYRGAYFLLVGGAGESFNPTSYLAHATVDGINGDDSYAQLNNPKRPYRTINVAMDALKNAIITAISSPVQCRAFCYVKQGVYFDEYTINREYIDMHFEYGAIVISDTDGKPVISDTDGNDEPVNITITGKGQFYHTRYNPQGLDNQAIAISNSNSKEFNFEAYEIDGIQIYGGAGVTTKLNVKNTRIRFTIFISLKKSIYFEKCKFLSGLEPNSFFHQDIEMNCNECEFILPSDDLDSLLEIRDISNNLVDIIDVSSGVASGTPFDIISGSREDLQNSHRAGHTHPMAAGIYVCNVYDTSDINFYCSITNSKIRIQKEGGIGIALIQNQEADFSDPKYPYFVFRDIHIEDETVGKTTTALVAKKLDSLTTTIPFMFASVISNCEVLEGSGYEAGYEAILPSYDFVPSTGGSASTPFTQTITGDGNTANDTRIIVHNKNNSTPSVQLWYEYESGKWRQLDVTQGITTETATPNELLLNLLAYEGNQTSNKYSIIVQ